MPQALLLRFFALTMAFALSVGGITGCQLLGERKPEKAPERAPDTRDKTVDQPVRRRGSDTSSTVRWIMEYQAGMSRAQSKGRNAFILITAPTWCGPCRWMEHNTFPDARVVRLLNNHYVAIRILDKVDGQRNPDLQHFKFRGYPTYIIKSPEGNELFRNAGSVGPDRMIAILNQHK